MLFSIFLWVIPTLLIGAPLITLFLYRHVRRPYEEALGAFRGALILSVLPLLVVWCTWSAHADDIAVIKHQEAVEKVLAEEVTALSDQLQSFDYEKGTLLNADSPVAAAVGSLSEARKRLSDARTKKAEAIVRIEARRIGLMSNVFHWAGDYK